MKRNMGFADRTIRLIVALIIGILFFTDVISGAAALVLSLLALVFIVTGIVGFCPLYLPFGFTSKR